MNLEIRPATATESRASDAPVERFGAVRARSEVLALPLSAEDAQIQSMPDASPAKWHLAHTTWFFETFVLRTYEKGFTPYHPDFHYLFNSYYEAEGERHPRPQRGMLTRPSLHDVLEYRHATTERLVRLIEGRPEDAAIAALVELGCQHEEQHQELLLTDIKHALSLNPLAPAYKADSAGMAVPSLEAAPALARVRFPGGACEIGSSGEGFAFDNELPRHPVYVREFALGSRLVTNAEYRDFLDDGGYTEPRLWLAQGWDWVQANARTAPLYWQQRDGVWFAFTLHGLQPLNAVEPVVHLSYFEADAFATWAGARLPREEELEIARATQPADVPANDLGSGRLHPAVAPRTLGADSCVQLEGDVWEWTLSAYGPYPGFSPAPGALGEYNGKFMCGQFVLKGGSCLTPPGHARPTYRNFFPPEAQWQATGLRLAEDL